MCGSAAVFPKKKVEDDPVLKTPGEAKSYRQAKRTPTVHRCSCEERLWVAHFTSLRATVPQDTNMQRA